MSEQRRRSNKKNEFLLDVLPSIDGSSYWTIYDITHFLPHWNCRERTNYLARVTHSIVGKVYTIHIIDYHESLTTGQATKLSKEWFNENTTYHRLD